MAIVKCPECGGQISSTVKNCVHCGCRITVCPDCGRVYGELLNTCLFCGANLNGEVSAPQNSIKEESNKLEKRFNADAKTKKIAARICKIIEIVGTLFFFAVIGYGVFNSEDLLVAFFNGESWNFKSWKSLMTFALIFSGICDIVSIVVEDIINLYINRRGAEWLKSQKIDYESYIKNCDKMTLDLTIEISMFLYELQDVAFFVENEKEFKIDVIKIVTKFLFLIAFFISISVWFVANYNAQFAFALLGLEYSFDFSLPSFYSAVIFLCLFIVACFLFWLARSRRQKAWKTKKNFN